MYFCLAKSTKSDPVTKKAKIGGLKAKTDAFADLHASRLANRLRFLTLLTLRFFYAFFAKPGCSPPLASLGF